MSITTVLMGIIGVLVLALVSLIGVLIELAGDDESDHADSIDTTTLWRR